jgi:hypothetical protein
MYLKVHDGFEGEITNEDVICKDCYVRHKQIIAQAENITPMTLLAELKIQQQSFHERVCIDNFREYFVSIADMVTIDVINMLECDEAVLLPVLYEKFCLLVNTNKTKLKVVEDIHVPQSRWLLTQICNKLGSYVETITKHKKYGVLLYKRDGDILKALSSALGQVRDSTKREVGIRRISNEYINDKLDAYRDKTSYPNIYTER